jgi:aminopeptidase-like protein
MGVDYRKGEFRMLIGSDEYIFNDPLVGIPGIMLSRYPYDQYHTSDDTIDIILEDKIKETQDVILKTIEIYEKDYVPVKCFKGPLMRSKYKIQSQDKMTNLNLDYLFYDIDGKKYLSEICVSLGLPFEFAYNLLEKLKEDNLIKDAKFCCSPNSKKRKQKTTRKKLSRV